MTTYKVDILEKVIRFVVDIINFTKTFKNDPAGYSLAKQIIDAAGSIGANIVEARNARSRKEFIATIGISFKETKETKYW